MLSDNAKMAQSAKIRSVTLIEGIIRGAEARLLQQQR